MNTSTQADLEELAGVCANAVLAGMRVVRPYQTGEIDVAGTSLKPDESLVTVVDGQSESAILTLLADLHPDIPVLAEEAGRIGFDDTLQAYHGDLVFLVDPVDGTFPLAVGGSTSGIAVGLYSRWLQRIVAAAVGCPVTGQLYVANEGSRTHLERYDTSTWLRTDGGVNQPCHTWQGSLSNRCAIFLDGNGHGFTRTDYFQGGQREVLSEDQMGRLIEKLRGASRILMLGSNADHQRLVAAGGHYAAGSITTAVGGPWDLIGVMLVTRAGGKAIGFRIQTDHDDHSWLAQVDDELDALSCDVVVTAHDDLTLTKLVSLLERAVMNT